MGWGRIPDGRARVECVCVRGGGGGGGRGAAAAASARRAAPLPPGPHRRRRCLHSLVVVVVLLLGCIPLLRRGSDQVGAQPRPPPAPCPLQQLVFAIGGVCGGGRGAPRVFAVCMGLRRLSQAAALAHATLHPPQRHPGHLPSNERASGALASSPARVSPPRPQPPSRAMYLMYYIDGEGKRVYTMQARAREGERWRGAGRCLPRALHARRPTPREGRDEGGGAVRGGNGVPRPPQKEAPDGTPTQSAHPARFSPDDKFSRERITCKRRFKLLPTQHPAYQY